MKHLIKKLLREGLDGSDEGITLYHKVGNKQTDDMGERIKNVINNGLIPYDAIGGKYSERGNVIWFASNYETYGNDGDFVLSIEYKKENINKFNMHFDGQYATASKPIPFEDLEVIKIPVGRVNGIYLTDRDFIEELIPKYKVTPDKFNNLPHKDNVVYVDLFNKYVQPYIGIDNYVEQLDSSKIKLINLNTWNT